MIATVLSSFCDSFFDVRVGLVEKLLRVDNTAGVPALADQLFVIVDLHLELELSAVNGNQRASAQDGSADGGGSDMLDIDPGADRGHLQIQRVFHRLGAAALAQRDHRRRGEYAQGAAAHHQSGVLVGDGNGFFPFYANR